MSDPIERAIELADQHLESRRNQPAFEGSYLLPVTGMLYAMRLMAREIRDLRRTLGEIERQAKHQGWNTVRISPTSPGDRPTRSPPSWN